MLGRSRKAPLAIRGQSLGLASLFGVLTSFGTCADETKARAGAGQGIDCRHLLGDDHERRVMLAGSTLAA